MRISDWSSDVCSSDLSREWIQSRRAPLRARWGKPPSSAADEWLFTSECEDLGEGGACLTGQFCGRPRASSRRLIAGERDLGGEHGDVLRRAAFTQDVAEFDGDLLGQIGRASCSDRVCQYV